jgi:hypothetical protein
MPILHNVTQYSEAYDRLKLGIPTSSNFHKIITPQGKPSKQWPANYKTRFFAAVFARRSGHRRIHAYRFPYEHARLPMVLLCRNDWYEFDQDVTVQLHHR